MSKRNDIQNAISNSYVKCKPNKFYMVHHGKGGHKYEVKVVTTSLDVSEQYKNVRVFYADSIRNIELDINQFNDYYKKVYSGFYDVLKNGYNSAYYVTRLY